MRKSLCVLGASSISIPIPSVPGRRLLLACVCGLALAVLAPGAALADTMSLRLSKEAVQSATTQVIYTASSEVPGFVSLAVNKANEPCGPTPEAEYDSLMSAPEPATLGQIGVYSESVNYTPTESGSFVICGWVTSSVPYQDVTGAPVLASASLPIEVRLPHVSLALSLSRRVTPNRSFGVTLMATSEVAREVILVGLPYTSEGCPINQDATAAQSLIDSVITGGPRLKTVTLRGLPAGSRWIFCAWAVVPGTLWPEATTSIIVNVPRSLPRSKPKRRKQGRAARGARACGTEKIGDVITATIRASGISCRRAHGVVHTVEYTRWPSDVAVPPYFSYSRPYGVSTKAGRFTCRFEPFGLAGTEHNIHCKQKQISVSWSTIHD
jgi:hypothetical protein